MQRTFEFYTLKRHGYYFKKIRGGRPMALIFEPLVTPRAHMTAKQLKKLFSSFCYSDFERTHIIKTTFTITMDMKEIPDFDYDTLDTFFKANVLNTTRTQTRYNYISDNPSLLFEVPLVFFHDFDHDNPYVSIATHYNYQHMIEAYEKLNHPNKRYRDEGDGFGNPLMMKTCMIHYFKNHPDIYQHETLQRYAQEHPNIFSEILSYKELILPETPVLHSPL